MRHLLWTAVAAALLLPAPPLAAASPEAGRALAEQWCAGCHLVDPSATVGADVAPPFTAMANDPERTLDRLHAWVTVTPHPVMPNLDLTLEEIADINAYLDSLIREEEEEEQRQQQGSAASEGG